MKAQEVIARDFAAADEAVAVAVQAVEAFLAIGELGHGPLCWLPDRQRVDDDFERLADVRGESRRGSADAANFATAVEIVGAVQSHVLRGFSFQEEQCYPQHGGVLLNRAATHAFHAGIVGHVLFALHYLAPFDLPAPRDVVHIVETFANQGVRKSHDALPLSLLWLFLFGPREVVPSSAGAHDPAEALFAGCRQAIPWKSCPHSPVPWCLFMAVLPGRTHKTMCNRNWTMGKPNVNLAWHLSTKKFMKNKEKRNLALVLDL